MMWVCDRDCLPVVLEYMHIYDCLEMFACMCQQLHIRKELRVERKQHTHTHTHIHTQTHTKAALTRSVCLRVLEQSELVIVCLRVSTPRRY